MKYNINKLKEGMHELMKYGLMQVKSLFNDEIKKVGTSQSASKEDILAWTEQDAIKEYRHIYADIAKRFIPVDNYDKEVERIIKIKLKELSDKLK